LNDSYSTDELEIRLALMSVASSLGDTSLCFVIGKSWNQNNRFQAFELTEFNLGFSMQDKYLIYYIIMFGESQIRELSIPNSIPFF
jgi:hypothetical protein